MKKKVSLAKRLNLAEARADDAQRQINEAERRARHGRELQIERERAKGLPEIAPDGGR